MITVDDASDAAVTRKTLMTVKLLVKVDDSDAADDKKDVDCWRSHLDSSAAPPM